mgnify:CR=1 FL=1|jgi:hypothetical protein
MKPAYQQFVNIKCWAAVGESYCLSIELNNFMCKWHRIELSLLTSNDFISLYRVFTYTVQTKIYAHGPE